MTLGTSTRLHGLIENSSFYVRYKSSLKILDPFDMKVPILKSMSWVCTKMANILTLQLCGHTEKKSGATFEGGTKIVPGVELSYAP